MAPKYTTSHRDLASLSKIDENVSGSLIVHGTLTGFKICTEAPRDSNSVVLVVDRQP